MKKWLEYVIIGAVLVFAVFETIQLLRKNSQSDQEQAARVELSAEMVGSVKSLEILPLFDAAAVNSEYLTGNGVSYLITTPEMKVLLDLGWNPDNLEPSPLQQNMEKAGVSIADLQALVITHDHPDHVGGTKWWLNKTFSFGSEQTSLTGIRIYLPEEMKYPETNPVVATDATKIGAGMATIGAAMYENPLPISLLRPTGAEQSVAVKVDGYGVVLITGCGHPGLQSMVERTEALFGEPVVAVIGGLHYQQKTATELAPDLNLLRSRNLKLIALSPHDSDASVLELVKAEFPEASVDLLVGQPIHLGE